MTEYFAYGSDATDYLKAKDKKMRTVIERVGHIDRPVDTEIGRAHV